MPNHVMRPVTAVMFANQPKTVPELVWIPIYARNANDAEQIIAA